MLHFVVFGVLYFDTLKPKVEGKDLKCFQTKVFSDSSIVYLSRQSSSNKCVSIEIIYQTKIWMPTPVDTNSHKIIRKIYKNN